MQVSELIPRTLRWSRVRSRSGEKRTGFATRTSASPETNAVSPRVRSAAAEATNLNANTRKLLEDVFVCYANGISGADVESLSLDYQARPGCERGRDTDLGEGERERGREIWETRAKSPGKETELTSSTTNHYPSNLSPNP